MLIVPIEHPGELVGRVILFARMWPGGAVEKSNLGVQVAALCRCDHPLRPERIFTAFHSLIDPPDRVLSAITAMNNKALSQRSAALT
jgi:hypothetical protein